MVMITEITPSDRVAGARGHMAIVKGPLTGIRGQMTVVRGQVTVVKSQVRGFRGLVTGFRGQVTVIRDHGKVERSHGKVERSHVTSNRHVDHLICQGRAKLLKSMDRHAITKQRLNNYVTDLAKGQVTTKHIIVKSKRKERNHVINIERDQVITIHLMNLVEYHVMILQKLMTSDHTETNHMTDPEEGHVIAHHMTDPEEGHVIANHVFVTSNQEKSGSREPFSLFHRRN